MVAAAVTTTARIATVPCCCFSISLYAFVHDSEFLQYIALRSGLFGSHKSSLINYGTFRILAVSHAG